MVAPTQMLSLSARWMGGTTAREQLASLWKADDSGKVHWFYTVADRRDPSVLTSSVDLGIVDAPAAVKPSLAHINDIAENQFDRIAVWVDGERLCWWRVNALDPPAVPRSCLDLNFDSKQPILLADPPLQLRDGGLAAVVTGVGRSGPMAMWIHLGKDGKSDVRNRPIQSPGLGAIVWKEAEDSPSGTLYIASPSGRISRMESAGKEQPVFDAAGQQVLLTQTQWLGNGLVFGVFRRGQNLEVQRFGPGAPEKLSSWSMPDGWRIEQAEGFNAGVAVVCRTVSGGLAVFDSKGMHQFKSGTVVATPTSLILIEHRRGQGFVITPVN